MTNKMLMKKELDKTYFVPMDRMHKIIDFLKSDTNEYVRKQRPCEINLHVLQRTRLNTLHYSLFGKQNWVIMFSLACRKALYSHDWDKLLFLLQKVPKWKFSASYNFLVFDAIYIRHLTLLLMYHPSAQAKALLNEYLHMTLGCRSDSDKKALLKVLLDLPKKLPAPLVIRNSKNKADDPE